MTFFSSDQPTPFLASKLSSVSITNSQPCRAPRRIFTMRRKLAKSCHIHFHHHFTRSPNIGSTQPVGDEWPSGPTGWLTSLSLNSYYLVALEGFSLGFLDVSDTAPHEYCHVGQHYLEINLAGSEEFNSPKPPNLMRSNQPTAWVPTELLNMKPGPLVQLVAPRDA